LDILTGWLLFLHMACIDSWQSTNG